MSYTVTSRELLPLRHANSIAYKKSLVASQQHGYTLAVFGYNSGPEQFIQLHDAALLQSLVDGSVPFAVIKVPAASNFSFDIPYHGIPHVNGLIVTNSSTGPTLTIGADDCYFTAVVLP